MQLKQWSVAPSTNARTQRSKLFNLEQQTINQSIISFSLSLSLLSFIFSSRLGAVIIIVIFLSNQDEIFRTLFPFKKLLLQPHECSSSSSSSKAMVVSFRLTKLEMMIIIIIINVYILYCRLQSIRTEEKRYDATEHGATVLHAGAVVKRGWQMRGISRQASSKC